MTERQMQIRIGLVVLVAMLLFVGFVLSVGQRSTLFQERYSLRAYFTSTEGLAVGAPVRLAGVTVGNVTRVSFSPNPQDRRILLTLSVERRAADRIRADSVASIGTIGLVGDKVLDITVGSFDTPILPPEAVLPSVNAIDYSALLQKGDQILDHVNRISASLDEFLAGGGGREGKRNVTEALKSLRDLLSQVQKGQGLLHDLIYGREGVDILARLDHTLQSLQQVTSAVQNQDGLLHALIYSPPEQTLGRLNQAVANLNDLLLEAKQGKGLLHALLYEPEGAQILHRLDRASTELESFAQAARQGKGLLPSLLFDPAGAKAVADVQAAAADVRKTVAEFQAAAADLHAVADKLRQGQGTVGALLEDPTVYEDLSTLLRGANRSWLLRSLIRSTLENGRAGAPETRQDKAP